MKIAAIAGRYGQIEIPSDSVSLAWIWVNDPSDLLNHTDADCFIDLDFIPTKERIHQLSSLLPAPVLINSVIHTLEDIGRPFIRINAWPGCLDKGLHELAVANNETASQIKTLYEKLGWNYRLVPDIPGMISCRIVVMIINEAYYTLEAKVSSREEIDAAMRLGTNYPHGPFEWAALIGEDLVCNLLEKLTQEDDRYQPCPALKNRQG